MPSTQRNRQSRVGVIADPPGGGVLRLQHRPDALLLYTFSVVLLHLAGSQPRFPAVCCPAMLQNLRERVLGRCPVTRTGGQNELLGKPFFSRLANLAGRERFPRVSEHVTASTPLLEAWFFSRLANLTGGTQKPRLPAEVYLRSHAPKPWENARVQL